jgi:hypothetical protein
MSETDERAAAEPGLREGGLPALAGRLGFLFAILTFFVWLDWFLQGMIESLQGDGLKPTFVLHLARMISYQGVSILVWTFIVLLVALLARWALGTSFARFVKS